MQVTDVAINYGGGLTYRKFTIPWNDPLLIALGAVTSGQIPLKIGSDSGAANFSLPQGAKIIGVFVKHSIAFTGTGPLTALTLSLGKNGGSTTLFTSTFDVFQAVADTTLQETAMFKAGQLTSLVPAVNFVATGGNLNVLLGGSVDVYVLFLNVTMPSA